MLIFLVSLEFTNLTTEEILALFPLENKCF